MAPCPMPMSYAGPVVLRLARLPTTWGLGRLSRLFLAIEVREVFGFVAGGLGEEVDTQAGEHVDELLLFLLGQRAPAVLETRGVLGEDVLEDLFTPGSEDGVDHALVVFAGGTRYELVAYEAADDLRDVGGARVEHGGNFAHGEALARGEIEVSQEDEALGCHTHAREIVGASVDEQGVR